MKKKDQIDSFGGRSIGGWGDSKGIVKISGRYCCLLGCSARNRRLQKGVQRSSECYRSFTCFAASDGRVVVGVRRRMVSIEEDAGYCIQTSTCITPKLYLSSNLLFTSEPLSRMTITMDSWLCKREAVKRWIVAGKVQINRALHDHVEQGAAAHLEAANKFHKRS